jgi:hypothetical protein
MENKQHYLKHLANSLRECYFNLEAREIVSDQLKGYINGYMTAGRIAGIGFDELKTVIEREKKYIQNKTSSSIKQNTKYQNDLGNLEIPTFVRERIKTKMGLKEAGIANSQEED